MMDVLNKNVKDVESISSIQNRCAHLETSSADKDGRIQELEVVVRALNKFKAQDEKYLLDKEACIETERQGLDEEKKEFEKRKTKDKKRSEMRMEEQEANYNTLCDKLKRHHDAELEEHKK
jgi:hypothetical protein